MPMILIRILVVRDLLIRIGLAVFFAIQDAILIDSPLISPLASAIMSSQSFLGFVAFSAFITWESAQALVGSCLVLAIMMPSSMIVQVLWLFENLLAHIATMNEIPLRYLSEMCFVLELFGVLQSNMPTEVMLVHESILAGRA